MAAGALRSDGIPLGIGYYNVPEAARLLKTSPQNINRWLGGYTYRTNDGRSVRMPPLWEPQLPREDDHLELGFRDLVELRFVIAFQHSGLGLNVIRKCLEFARECAGDARPFSTRRFKTDGKTIFLDSIRHSGDVELLDLRKRQYVIKQIIERSFKDLDIEAETVTRWRPFNGKQSIVIDPARAFGQPIVARYGVPTVALAEAVKTEGTVDRVAAMYEVSAASVRDAARFEASLHTA